jgi:hypothetical protein
MTKASRDPQRESMQRLPSQPIQPLATPSTCNGSMHDWQELMQCLA